MNTFVKDLRYALRTLRRTPGFTAVAVLTLALGIGANTAIFSVVNAVLLKPLPFEAPDRLVQLYETYPHPGGRGRGSVSVPNFRDWREQNGAFEAVAAYSWDDLNLQGVSDPERLAAIEASANLFETLGVEPLLGRTFLPGEDEAGASPVVLLSEGLWRRRFAADRDVLGTTITLDGVAHTVVGVVPPEARFPVRSDTDLWVPLRFTPSQAASRGSHFLQVVARLDPGVTLAAAQAEMSRIAARIAEEYPAQQEGRGARVVPLRDVVVGNVRPALLILLGAAGFVLLIACANAANLLLARSAARGREVAVRAALGAGRSRLVRQFLTESLVLAGVGAMVGLVFAQWGVDLLAALGGDQLPRAAAIRFDTGVFAFLLLVAALTGIGFGLVPALHASRADLHEDLKEGGRQGSIDRRGRRFRSALVVAEVALSLVLLIGAGLLMRTFLALQRADTGMATENVLTLRIAVPARDYADGESVATGFYRPVLERVRALPGVRAAGLISHLPLQESGMNGGFGIEGRPPERQLDEPFAEFRRVSAGYFAALGIPVTRGRDLSERDAADAPPVVLINEALARRYFPNEDPIGKRILRGDVALSIVGVAGDVRESRLDRESAPTLYFSHRQQPRAQMTMVVSTAVPATTLTGAIRAAIREVDPDQPIYDVQTMERVVAQSVSDRRLYFWLLGSFAALAVVLAAAGIYGVISYAVAQRTREIGIRMALGGEPAAVLRLVVGQGARLAALGLLIGLPAAFALTWVLGGLLYGVSAADPATFAAVALLLAAVALLAAYIPARRAARVDPMAALRSE